MSRTGRPSWRTRELCMTPGGRSRGHIILLGLLRGTKPSYNPLEKTFVRSMTRFESRLFLESNYLGQAESGKRPDLATTIELSQKDSSAWLAMYSWYGVWLRLHGVYRQVGLFFPI